MCTFSDALQSGVHTSVKQLQVDSRAFVDRYNQNPKLFKWIKSAGQILAPIERFCQKTQKILFADLQPRGAISE